MRGGLVVKKIFFLTVFLFLGMNMFMGAEVSEIKDVGVFSVFTTYKIPETATRYFDDQLVALLNDMNRFRVIGYQYKFDTNLADKFIVVIGQIKQDLATKNPDYFDRKLGATVIPATDLEKLANSLLIIIPSITEFSETQNDVEDKEKHNSKIGDRIEKEYKTHVSIAVKIVTYDGTLMDTYNATREFNSRVSSIDAYNRAISDAIAGLNYRLRNVKPNQITTRVLKVEGNQVSFENRTNMRLKLGSEFAIQRQVKLSDRLPETDATGLMRVNSVGGQYSTATLILGAPQPDDRLIEKPMAGIRFNVFIGAFPMSVGAVTNAWLTNSIGSQTNYYYFKHSDYAVNVGLSFDYELGYCWLINFNAGLLFNDVKMNSAFLTDIFGYHFDLGGGYEFFFGPFSFTAGADISVIGLYKDLGQMYETHDFSVSDPAKTFKAYQVVNVSMTGFTFGMKPVVTLNWQIGQRIKFRLFGGYALFFAPSCNLNYSQINGASTVSDSVAVKFPADFNGIYGGAELVLRF